LCTQNPPFYRPYLRYLLALAYEMNGQPEPAKLAYFRLWRDFPASLFGLAAGLKLGEIGRK
jgi:hypothetical protein